MEKKKKSIFVIITSIFFFMLMMLSGCLVLIFSNVMNKSENDSQTESYVSSNKKTDALTSLKDQISEMRITLKFGDSENKLYGDTIGKMLTVVKKNDDTYSYETHDNEIEKYVRSLAEKYNNYYSTIEFTTRDGDKIQLENKNSGWILDEEKAIEEIRKLLLNKKSVTVDLTDGSEESDKWWTRIVGVYKDLKNYGGEYIEVSIDDQHFWVYKDNKIILESDIVTGQPNLGNDTPKGAFMIENKKEKATLYGQGYNTVVDHWIGICDDIGFHDAQWQDYFGGYEYLTHGSHGCVNLPADAAGKLYDIASVGMPVFIY